MTALPAWIDGDAWNGFVDMRRLIKKPLTARAEALILKQLIDFKNKGHDPNLSLDQSTLCNWQDVYPPKGKEVPNLRREVYQPEPARTTEQRAGDVAARDAAMAKLNIKLVKTA